MITNKVFKNYHDLVKVFLVLRNVISITRRVLLESIFQFLEYKKKITGTRGIYTGAHV